jgi:hypothetical protein
VFLNVTMHRGIPLTQVPLWLWVVIGLLLLFWLVSKVVRR